MRQTSRRLEGFVEQVDLVMLFQDRSKPADHQDRFVFARLIHLDDLKTARQRGIFFEVLLVLRPCGGRDGTQGSPGQSRFEQVRSIALSGRTPSPDQRVRLVDEENDRFR